MAAHLSACAMATCIAALGSGCASRASSAPTASASSSGSAPRPALASNRASATSGVEQTRTVATSSAYHDGEGGYSIQFRSPPEVNRRRVPDGDSSSLTIAAVAIDADRFQSSSFIELDRPAILECAAAIAANGIGHPGCTLQKSTDMTLGGLDGVEIAFRCNDGVHGMKRIFCRAKLRESKIDLYAVEFLADPRIFKDAEAGGFFDSLKLDAPP
jgi:hypothetical protein